jgi:hypothetical protein
MSVDPAPVGVLPIVDILMGAIYIQGASTKWSRRPMIMAEKYAQDKSR